MEDIIAVKALQEAATFDELSPEEQIAAQSSPIQKTPKKRPSSESDLFDKDITRYDRVGSTDRSKLENFYKVYFRKLIDSQIKSFGAPLTKRTNITQIGAPSGTNPNDLIALWKNRNPEATNLPTPDQIKTDLAYEEASILLNKYVKEAFGESKKHHLSLASFSQELKVLKKEEITLGKELKSVNKEISDIEDNINRKGSFSEFAPKNKSVDQARLAELKALKDELTNKFIANKSKILHFSSKQEGMTSPSAEMRVDQNKLNEYVLAVLNVSANQEVEQGPKGVEAKNQWPNDSKRPPVPASPEMATIRRYELAISQYRAHPSDAGRVEIEALFREIEENAAPVFADFFGLTDLHLEGVIDPITKEPKFPEIQLMNVLITKLIEVIHNLARKSEIVQREIKTVQADKTPKLSDTYTDLSGNKQKLSRTLASISENEMVAFHNLFNQNRYAAVGAAFSDAERAMYTALQKNLNSINLFLENNKDSVISLANSLGNKLAHYAGAHPDPKNDYTKEFELYGLDFLAVEDSDTLDPNDPNSLIKKSRDLQFKVRQAAYDLTAKWLVNFMKIPPEAKPFAEVGKFLKLVDDRFSVKEDDDAFEVTASGISSAFFNPSLFFLVLVDNRNKLNASQTISAEDFIRSDWGKHFRAYMGAQKLKYTSPREDMSVLLDIGRFMREGFVPQQVAQDQLSDLGKRLAKSSEPREVPNSLGLSLVSGDKNQVVNSRDFLNKLKESAPNDYSFSIFQRLIDIKTQILNKKALKEYEAAKVLYDGPYMKAKADVITILSPVLREYLFQRYSQDTRLIETVHLFYALLREFDKLIDKYDPQTDGDIENWLLSNLEEFNKSKIVRAMHGGSDRLWYIPQSNEQLKSIINSILELAEVRENVKPEQFYAVRRLAPASQKVDKTTSLIKYSYVDDTKKDANGRSAYDREKARAIRRIDKKTGKEVFEVIDKSSKDVKFYSLEPKESIIRDPEQAAKIVRRIWSTLENTFWQNLEKIGFKLKGANISNPNSEYPESSLDQYYFDQLHRKLAGYDNLGTGKAKKKAKIVEPIAASGEDKPNTFKKTDQPDQEILDIDNKLMELLSVASILFDAINIDEKTFMSKVDVNMYSNISKAYNSTNTLNNVKAVVNSLFRKDWATVHDLLFKQIGNASSLPNSDIQGTATGKISQQQRENVKEPLIMTIGTILATAAHIIRDSSQKFMESQSKNSGILETLGVDSLYSGYSKMLDSLKELLASAFLHRLGKVQPMRGIPKGRGVTAKGRWGVLSFNMDGTASVRHPFTMHNKWLKMAEGLGYEFAQNQDPTSDTRQQATMAMLNAQNRFMYNLQQFYKKQRGEEVGPNEGNPVKLDNILRTLGNSIEGEVGGAFRDMYRSRRFAGTSWKNGDLDVYHYRIIKILRKKIEELGYRVDRPEWFEQNAELQKEAIAIVEKDIKEHYLKGIETGGALAGPGDAKTSGVSGPSNPLHKSGINPDARLLGDQEKKAPSIYSPDYSTEMQGDTVDQGFLGNTNVTQLSDEQKKINAERRLAQFVEIYPQFLEEKGMMNVSMSEPVSSQEDSSVLEDTLGEAATAENQVSLTTVLYSLDNHLDADTFSRIGSKRKKVFKSQEDADSNKNGISKFIESYKFLTSQDTSLVNSLVENLGWSVEASPFTSGDSFRAAINSYNTNSERNQAISEILFMKYFEYIYLREIVQAEIIHYLMDIEDKYKTTEEIRQETLQKETQSPDASSVSGKSDAPSSKLRSWPKISDQSIEKSKIQRFIENSEIPIKHIPGIEYTFISDSGNRAPLYEILRKIFTNTNESVKYMRLANSLIEYMGGRSDLPSVDDPTTYGISKKSNVQTDIHGMDASMSSKQEDSAVSRIDKKKFDLLNIRNMSKVVRDILHSDEEEDIERKLTYDEVRTIIRNLISIYNTPINTISNREELDWYVSGIKSSVNKIRNYLFTFTKTKSKRKDLISKIETIRNDVDSILRYSSYNRENLSIIKKMTWKVISTIYDLPLGEEEDFSSFDLLSPKQHLTEIYEVLKGAENASEEKWDATLIKSVSDAINKFGKALKEGKIEVATKFKEDQNEKDKIYRYLVNKGGILDTTLSKLKTKLKKGVLPVETSYEVSNYITQIIPYITYILHTLPEVQPRKLRDVGNRKDPKALANPEYDPFADEEIYPQDKKIVSDLEKAAGIPSKFSGTSYGSGTDEDPYRTTPDAPKRKAVKKESKDFQPFKQSIAVGKIIKCIKTLAAGVQKLPYTEYGQQYPAKLSRILFELARQESFDVDNYRVFITEENRSKVNVVFEYTDRNRRCTPEYMWVIPKRATSSN